MADVFVSYCRRDEKLVRELVQTLRERGKDVWVDWQDIPATAEWLEEVYAGIAGSDAFLFVVTRESLRSSECRRELLRAAELNKRIVPVVYGDLDGAAIPDAIAMRQWIVADEDTTSTHGADQIVIALERDLAWVRGHTQWSAKADEWSRHRRDRSFLLRGAELASAEAWLTQANAQAKDPPPTALHYEHVFASRSAATRRQRVLFASVASALVVATALAVLALWQRDVAIDERRTAESRLLANEALSEMDEQLETAALLSVAAYDVKPTPEARSALLIAAGRAAQVNGFLRGDEPRVFGVSFTHDGRGLATATGGRTVPIWNVSERRRTAGLEAHESDVRAVEFSPVSMLLASRGDGEVILWDLDRPRPKGQRVEVPGATAFAFSRSGVLAIGTRDGEVVLWDVERGAIVERLRVNASRGDVYSVAFAPRGTAVAVGHQHGLTVVPDGGLRTPRRMKSYALGEPIVSVAYGTRGRVGAITADEAAAVWSTNTSGGRKRTLVATGANAIAASASGDLAIGSSDGDIRLWADDWQETPMRLTGHGDAVTDLDFSPEGSRLASASFDGTTIVWQVRSRSWVRELQALEPLDDIAFVDAGRELALAGDGRVVLRRLADGSELELRGSPAGPLRLATDGRRVVAAAGDAGTTLWVASRTAPQQLRSGPVTAIAVSEDGRTLVDALETRDGASLRRRALSGTRAARSPQQVAKLPGLSITAIALHPRQPIVAVASSDGQLTLWDLEQRRRVSMPRRRGDEITVVTFSADGRLLGFGAASGSVAIWDTERERFIGTFAGHDAVVTDLAFSSDTDDYLLASSDDAGTIIFRDGRTGERVGGPLREATAAAAALEFHPGRRELAVARRGGIVVLYESVFWEPDIARARLCRLISPGAAASACTT